MPSKCNLAKTMGTHNIKACFCCISTKKKRRTNLNAYAFFMHSNLGKCRTLQPISGLLTGKLQNSPEICWFAWVNFSDFGRFCVVLLEGSSSFKINASSFMVYLSKKKWDTIPLWIDLKLLTHMKHLHTYLFGLNISTHVLCTNGNSSADLLKSRVTANLKWLRAY